jgi:4'-phosphopantetheinyl transferase
VIPPEGVCEVWVADPAAFAPHRHRLDTLLTPAERAHADGHRREADRHRLRLSRALLRLLLAGYLDRDPGTIAVDRRCPTCPRPHGRPRLPGSPLQLSVAHAAGLLVFAVRTGPPVGVDVEPIGGRGPEPPAELAELALTSAERRRLARVPPAGRWPEFLRHWTRKEAVLKQLGTGLSIPLQDVTVDPDDPTGRVMLQSPVDPAGRMKLGPSGRPDPGLWAGDLDLGPAWVGAVATTTPAPALRIAELAPSVVAGVGTAASPHLGVCSGAGIDGEVGAGRVAGVR